MKKFITSSYGNEIREQEITRETEKCYFIPVPHNRKNPEDRRLKDQHYHGTWNEAYAFLLNRQESRVESYQSQLDRAKSDLMKIKEMLSQEPV